nr:hypothetical protein [Pyrinomonadaceae bacterium]
MNLLPKSLYKLKELQIEENALVKERLRELKYRKLTGWFVFIFIILAYPISSFFTIKFFISSIGKEKVGLEPVLYVLSFLILLLSISFLIDLYTSIFDYFFRKTTTYQIIKNLEDILLPVEKQIENE